MRHGALPALVTDNSALLRNIRHDGLSGAALLAIQLAIGASGCDRLLHDYLVSASRSTPVWLEPPVVNYSTTLRDISPDRLAS